MGSKKSKEELKEAKTAAKDELSVAKQELKAFEKENKLAKGEDHSGHEKLGKKWGKLKATVDKKEKALAEIDEQLKEAKSEGGAGRATKYEYPEGCTSAKDKKAFRTKMRAEKNKADKPKKEKPSKEKVEKEEGKKSKKDKGEKKEKKEKKGKSSEAETEED